MTKLTRTDKLIDELLEDCKSPEEIIGKGGLLPDFGGKFL